MIKKSKSIEQIFEEVKDYDLVITNDAPLATGLNRLVEKPRLDYFAMTPRQIAAKFSFRKYARLYLKNEVIIEITKCTRAPLKIVHQNLEKIWEIWNHTGLLDSLHKFFPEGAKLIDLLKKFPTIELAMENFDESFYGNKSIAVAGIDMFNLLDKQVLPKRGKFPHTVEIFAHGKFEMNKSYLFSSFNELVNQTVALINKENENDVAIVLNPDSEYLNVIRARLKEKGITLNLKEFLSREISTKNIISLISLSFEIADLKVSDIILLESVFDFVRIDRTYGNYYLQHYMDKINKDKPLKSIFEFMSGISSLTFRQFFTTLEKNYQTEVRSELKEIINQLDLTESIITPDSINLINYFIRFIDAEVSGTNEGVLFANALNSAFVDRPVVFFIGLDESWTRLNPQKAYLDRDEEERKNLDKFQILLSQGKVKFNFVLGVKENVAVNPCYYFNILADRNISGFENEFFKATRIRYINSEGKKEPSEIPRTGITPDAVTEISPTALGNFINCPKGYSYSLMLPDEELSHFTKGKLLHSFAEFYFNHPEYSTENFDFILDSIINEYKGFVRDTNISVERTNFNIGMRIAKKFIDEGKFEKVKNDENVLFEDNFLFALTGKEKIYKNTELKIGGNAAKVKGKIDLFSYSTIVDYKSGRSKKLIPTILQEYKIENMKENLDNDIGFQTVAYIAGKRDEAKKHGLEFIYVYLLSDKKNVITGKFELHDSIAHVKYIHMTFKDFLLTNECFDILVRKDKKNLYSKLGFDGFKKIITDNIGKVDFFDREKAEELLANAICGYMIDVKKINLKEFKKGSEATFIKDIIIPALRNLFDIRAGTKSEGYIFKDDVDEFVKMVSAAIDDINKFQKTDFPNKPLFDLREVCQECGFLNICIGNKLWSGNEASVRRESANTIY